MSNKDYTKYSREPQVTKEPVIEPVQEPEVETPAVEPVQEPEVKPAPQHVIESTTFPATTTKAGFVYGCTRLNVRSEPSSTASILCEIENKTEVEIDLDNSTDDFYKVCLASGIEGFCVKSYIIEK